ncbi:hypothetical protein M9H77_11879 [Catharanthus roseus]|uniref:Uncharacterized protein n=1 Tax=Catharanthus roseus TaxID=4058 RepID=A0ACC0BFV7_CATRO|nr:hypothetical protein M9H77_11879 [Catharanthus roseus]
MYEVSQNVDLSVKVDASYKKFDQLLALNTLPTNSLNMQGVCAICYSPSHIIYDCFSASLFSEFVQEQVNSAQGFRRQNDPYSNTYNPGFIISPGGNETGIGRRVDEQGDGVRRRIMNARKGCSRGVGIKGMLCTDNLSIDDVMKMTFDSVEDADVFYMTYSRCVGFSFRKGDRKIDKKGITRIKYDVNQGKYIVPEFVKEHNHDMACEEYVRMGTKSRSCGSVKLSDLVNRIENVVDEDLDHIEIERLVRWFFLYIPDNLTVKLFHSSHCNFRAMIDALTEDTDGKLDAEEEKLLLEGVPYENFIAEVQEFKTYSEFVSRWLMAVLSKPRTAQSESVPVTLMLDNLIEGISAGRHLAFPPHHPPSTSLCAQIDRSTVAKNISEVQYPVDLIIPPGIKFIRLFPNFMLY